MKMESSKDVVLCDAKTQDLWDTYVRQSTTATVCHKFAWRSIIQRAYGHRPFYLMAQDGEKVRGILPLILVKNPILGASLTSMPFLDYGGICADDEETIRILLAHALRIMHVENSRLLELRQYQPYVQIGMSRLDKVSMILDLSPGAEGIWRSLPAKVRNQVRKAEKCGLTICTSGGELLDEFYEMFVVNMRDLGSPVHDKAFFVEMCAAFGPEARVMLVRDGECTVGGLIGLFFKGTMLVPWASSLREYFSKCPNNLLYWAALQEGCKRGCNQFDFGRSTVGSGQYDFKKQWGAVPKQLHWQVVSANGNGGTTISTQDFKYRFILEAWKKLPVSVSRAIGPRIRKYLTN